MKLTIGGAGPVVVACVAKHWLTAHWASRRRALVGVVLQLTAPGILLKLVGHFGLPFATQELKTAAGRCLLFSH